MDFILLPVSIELARIKGGVPELPDAIKKDYENSIAELGTIAAKTLGQGISDPNMRKAAEAAQLIAQGKHVEASDLLDE